MGCVKLTGFLEVNGVLGDVPSNRTTRAGVVPSRQASNGTVWTVGGLAPSITGVDDGFGHFLRPGTNARVHMTPLCKTSVKEQDEREKYHGRVATALGIDRARRILDFNPISASSQGGGIAHLLASSATLCSPWSEAEWTRFRGPPSQFLHPVLRAAEQANSMTGRTSTTGSRSLAATPFRYLIQLRWEFARF
jgi:hypothetical protein